MTIDGKKVAFLIANEGVEEIELTGPWHSVQEAGGVPFLLAPEAGKAQALSHLDKAGIYDVDVPVRNANPADFDALVLPGGVANPDQLRTDETAVQFVRDFVRSGKPVAAICHGPWTLIEADAVRRANPDLVAQPAHRRPQRRGDLGRRGSSPRRLAHHEPQTR